MGLDQKINVTLKGGQECELYYRKVNFLRGYIIQNTALTDDSNGDVVSIPLSVIQNLYEKCNIVLNNRDKAEEKLPCKGGFFFGAYDYNEYYFDDVEIVRDDMKWVLDNKDDVKCITYWDWW